MELTQEAQPQHVWTCAGARLRCATQACYLGMLFRFEHSFQLTFAHLEQRMWASHYSLRNHYHSLSCSARAWLPLQLHAAFMDPVGSFASDCGACTSTMMISSRSSSEQYTSQITHNNVLFIPWAGHYSLHTRFHGLSCSASMWVPLQLHAAGREPAGSFACELWGVYQHNKHLNSIFFRTAHIAGYINNNNALITLWASHYSLSKRYHSQGCSASVWLPLQLNAAGVEPACSFACELWGVFQHHNELHLLPHSTHCSIHQQQ